jgi:hypothetical protein
MRLGSRRQNNCSRSLDSLGRLSPPISYASDSKASLGHTKSCSGSQCAQANGCMIPNYHILHDSSSIHDSIDSRFRLPDFWLDCIFRPRHTTTLVAQHRTHSQQVLVIPSFTQKWLPVVHLSSNEQEHCTVFRVLPQSITPPATKVHYASSPTAPRSPLMV